MSKNVKEIVTERIIELINEEGLLPWNKPWKYENGEIALKSNLLHPDKPYSFLNQWLLCNKEDDYYLTFNQIKKLGATLKKGSKASIITFWKILDFKEKDDNGKDVNKTVPLLRYYRVFGVSDVEGLSDHYQKRIEDTKESRKPKIEEINEHVLNENIEKFIAGTKAIIKHSEHDRAYYSPARDFINIPDVKYFADLQEYYAVNFHELVHWTGHESRLKRDLKNHFESEEYSKEELVAEIGASILKFKFYGNKVKFDNNAAYVKSWLSVLKDDPNMIISASSRAEKAYEYLI